MTKRPMFGLLKRLHRDQRGITGLETAIILIAFVVVASVFAYTVLSAGIFSSEKGKEAIHSGLEQARSSMELVGSVKAAAITADEIDDADDAWTASANVTGSTDTTDKKEGTSSVEFVVAGAFTTGLVAYENLGSTIDISDHYSARLWIKTDTDIAANVLRLVLDDTAGCGTALETLNIPAITAASGWTRVQVKLATPSALTAVACVGLNAGSDPVTPTVNVDLVEAPGEMSQLIFTVSNALNGEAIDLTTTTDARVDDITWTSTQMGKGDSDTLLEPGEKMQIQVNLEALNPMPVAYTEMALHVRPEVGSPLVIERAVPAVVDASMDMK
ncbi:MAG: flab1 [Dehalococcoidia bacterium]|nr:flab1 [Dehalococcoidia bacterium]